MRGTLWSYPGLPLKTLGAAFATTGEVVPRKREEVAENSVEYDLMSEQSQGDEVKTPENKVTLFTKTKAGYPMEG